MALLFVVMDLEEQFITFLFIIGGISKPDFLAR